MGKFFVELRNLEIQAERHGAVDALNELLIYGSPAKEKSRCQQTAASSFREVFKKS
ncbi:hypothetical protein ACTQ3U_09550 [Oscillospiraceae bacterium LCP25S3_F9]